jgi:hypothetical protein
MQVKAGTRLKSAVCETQVIVVRVPSEEVDLGCGGAPLLEMESDQPIAGPPAAELSAGTLIGKRYAEAELGLELLCTKGGAGSLTCNGAILGLKDAKPLPASD